MNKKASKIFTNTTLAVCGTSLVLSGCTNGYINIDDVQHYQISDVGEAAIPINLSEEDQEYLNFLNRLASDIIKNPNIAKDFAKNPTKYAEKYGFYREIDIDENLLHYILTLGDEDIALAIKNNNLSLIVKLMREKGYIKSSYTNLHFTKEQIEKIREIAKPLSTRSTELATQGDGITVEAVALAYSAIYTIAAVISQVGFVYNAAAAINVGAAINLGVWVNVKFWTRGTRKTTTRLIESEIMSCALNQNLSLKAISVKFSENTTYQVTNGYIEEVTEQAYDFIKSYQPDLINSMGESNLKNIIRLQVFSKND